ncbi:hypothetical protein BOQ64_21015 [Chryseobacterium sp. CH25]|nr:hypothetical protein BOQ64_21015 [Chryseobacterium sp. CH25]RXM62920.1 hypothetical protein BOQ60_18770 [Chryseobacterium sp. CH1]
MYDIFDLQYKYAILILKYDLIGQISSAIQEIKDLFISRNVLQIDFSKDQINYFNNFCKNIITIELYEDYEKLLKEF